MKRVLTLILVVGVAGLAWWFQQRRTYANFPPAAGTTWVAIGDSLTAGVGAEPGEDYPTLLSQRLGIPVVNAGIPGHTTQDGLERLDEILHQKPRVALLCLGGNDGLRGVSPDAMFANLEVIIRRLQQSGAFVVLIGIRSASLMDRHERRFAQLAKSTQTLHVPDILQGVFGRGHLMSDPVHPNAAGYILIADRIADALMPYLDQLR